MSDENAARAGRFADGLPPDVLGTLVRSPTHRSLALCVVEAVFDIVSDDFERAAHSLQVAADSAGRKALDVQRERDRAEALRIRSEHR